MTYAPATASSPTRLDPLQGLYKIERVYTTPNRRKSHCDGHEVLNFCATTISAKSGNHRGRERRLRRFGLAQ